MWHLACKNCKYSTLSAARESIEPYRRPIGRLGPTRQEKSAHCTLRAHRTQTFRRPPLSRTGQPRLRRLATRTGARMAAPASAADPGTAFKILLSCPDGLPRSRVRTCLPSHFPFPSPRLPSGLHGPFDCVEWNGACRRRPFPPSVGPPHGGKTKSSSVWMGVLLLPSTARDIIS